MENGRIQLVIPKGKTFEMFAEKLGIVHECDRSIVYTIPDLDIDVRVVRAKDVHLYIKNELADIAIVGNDNLKENEFDYNLIAKLTDNIYRVSLITHQDNSDNANLSSADSIGTVYENITKKHFLKTTAAKPNVMVVNGCTEDLLLSSQFDYIVDLVETGKTLEVNKLKEVKVLAEISIDLISGKHFQLPLDVLLKLLNKIKN